MPIPVPAPLGREAAPEEVPTPAEEFDAPVGPSDEEEASFLSEQSFQEAASAPLSVAAGPEPEALIGPLPALEDLVKRIPAPARELMDELFRAKFVSVKRVPKAALKNQRRG